MSDLKDQAKSIIVPFTAQMLDIVVNALAARAFSEVAHVMQHIAGHVQLHNDEISGKVPTIPPSDDRPG
jgi:hypothetical protein